MAATPGQHMATDWQEPGKRLVHALEPPGKHMANAWDGTRRKGNENEAKAKAPNEDEAHRERLSQ